MASRIGTSAAARDDMSPREFAALVADVKKELASPDPSLVTFSEATWKHIEAQNMSKTTFVKRTLLNEKIYRLIRNKVRKNWEFNVAFTVCVGLGLTVIQSYELMGCAGYHILYTDNAEHRKYYKLLESFHGKPIEFWNNLLYAIDMKLLGSS